MPPDGGGDGSIIYAVLVRLDRIEWQGRAQFLAIAARAMRNILVDYALRRKTDKRGDRRSRRRRLPDEIADLLRRVQNDLFDVGADLAVPVGTTRGKGREPAAHRRAHVTALEEACDRHSEALEPLTSFVLSGGTGAAAAFHVARTTCRRAERCAVALAEHEEVNPASLAYLNRLSDLLFILARVANDGGRGDVLWQPGASVAPDSA